MSDYATVLMRETPKARIAHRCQCCGRTIEPGETYEKQHNLWENHAYTFKVCAHCVVAAERAIELDVEYLSYEDIESGLCDYHESWTDLRMLVNIRRRWRDSLGRLVAVPVLETKGSGS